MRLLRFMSTRRSFTHLVRHCQALPGSCMAVIMLEASVMQVLQDQRRLQEALQKLHVFRLIVPVLCLGLSSSNPSRQATHHFMLPLQAAKEQTRHIQDVAITIITCIPARS